MFIDLKKIHENLEKLHTLCSPHLVQRRSASRVAFKSNFNATAASQAIGITYPKHSRLSPAAITRRIDFQKTEETRVRNWLPGYVTQFRGGWFPTLARHAYLEQTVAERSTTRARARHPSPLFFFLFFIREPRFAFKHVVCLIYASRPRPPRGRKGVSGKGPFSR